MRTIQTYAIITQDRKLTVDLPDDVTPGERQVVFVIEEAPSDDLPDLATIAQGGGSFDWLADEPDLYTDDDRERV